MTAITHRMYFLKSLLKVPYRACKRYTGEIPVTVLGSWSYLSSTGDVRRVVGFEILSLSPKHQADAVTFIFQRQKSRHHTHKMNKKYKFQFWVFWNKSIVRLCVQIHTWQSLSNHILSHQTRLWTNSYSSNTIEVTVHVIVFVSAPWQKLIMLCINTRYHIAFSSYIYNPWSCKNGSDTYTFINCERQR